MENKELDLLDTLKLAVSFIKWIILKIIQSVLWLIRFTLKNYIINGLFLILAFAWIFYSLKPENRRHTSEFTLRIHTMDSHVVKDMIKAFNIDVIQNKPLLMKELGVDFDTAKKIEWVKPHFFIDFNRNGSPDLIDYSDSYVVKDSLTVKMAYQIAVEIKTKADLDVSNIKDLLLYYLNSDSLLNKYLQSRLMTINEDINVVDSEMHSLDSLRNQEFISKTTKLKLDNNVFVGERNDYTQQILSLQDKRTSYLETKRLASEPVMLLTPIVKQASKTKIYIYMTRLGSMLFCGFILSLLVSYRKEVWETIKPQ